MKNRKTSKMLGVKGIGNMTFAVDMGDGSKTEKVALKDFDSITVCHSERHGVNSPFIATHRNTVVIGNKGSKKTMTFRRQDWMALNETASQHETTSGMYQNIRA